MNKKQIAVIGAGINGLATALKLLQEKYSVTIFAQETTPHTWSDIAPALCIPYHALPFDLVTKCININYKWCQQLQKLPETGIKLLDYYQYHPTTDIESCWMQEVGYDYTKLSSHELPNPYKLGLKSKIYRMDASLLLPYLQKQIIKAGGRIIKKYIHHIEDPILANFPIIINCTGANTTQFIKDPQAFPIKGQRIIIEKIAGLNKIQLAILDDQHYVAIVPRENDCWLGGTAIENDWDARASAQITDNILAKASAIIPQIRTKQILDVGVGFRTGRNRIRIEKQTLANNRLLIHNYGQGGSAFALAWGCAAMVLQHIES